MSISHTIKKHLYSNGLFNSLFLAKKRKSYLNKEFILSDQYDAIMTAKTSSLEEFTKQTDDAELFHSNYKHRHSNYNNAKTLGCWRWKALWQYKDVIAPLVFDSKLNGIDFGGANGPVSFNTTIVDFDDKDVFARKVNYRNLEDLKEPADFVFTSHTLEHIEDLDTILGKIKDCLKPNGKFIAHVPAYSCIRWRPGIHTNKKFNDHVWSFHLEGDENINASVPKPLAIDTKIKAYFSVETSEYVGDNSIMVIGTKA